MMNWFRYVVLGWLACGWGAIVFAGGSGLNVVVVVNQSSTNSVQLGNYYCEQRGVPPQNVLRINWTGSKTDWTRANLDTVLRTPLTAMLASRQLTNQIEYLLLSMDIPYRVTNTTINVPNNFNSTTAALFYGFKDNPANPLQYCSVANSSTNAYAGSESIFRLTPPLSAASNSWLTFLLTSSNLAQAKAVVDRGVASDASLPTQEVILTKGQDRLRNIRHYLFDDAIVNVRILGTAAMVRTNVADPLGLGLINGFQSGAQVLATAGSSFVPGALADNLTSFSGYILENSGHTDALDFLNAGATASYGTIIEPCSYLRKFPSSQLYFYQSRGFTAAESYYQSVTNPYQGLLIGEPLAAPFAQPASGTWINLPAHAVLAGLTNLSLQFTAATTLRPVQQIDWFLNGQLLHTVSNLPPRAGNLVAVTINGFTTNYSVPANATIKSVTSNLVLRLNANSFSNATKVVAFAHGDRIELQSLDLPRPGAATLVTANSSVGSGGLLTTHIVAPRTDFLDRVARGWRSFEVTNSFGSNVPVGAWLQATVIKTNGAVVTVGATNHNAANPLRLFARELFDRIATNAALATADGVVVENVNMHEDPPYDQFVYGFNDHSGAFDVVAHTPGWPEAQVRVRFTASSGLSFSPGTTNRLDQNLADLRPRNHLYLTAGLTNWNVTARFNTTTNADGYHHLTAVAYEGSHVRTQKHISQNVRIQNNGWAATLTTLVGATNTAVEAMLQFAITANTNNITQIELFSTGGSLGISNNLASTTFAIPAAYLGIGRHPFYAVVTRSDGRKYRTETQWLRVVGAEPPFTVSVVDAAPTLAWPATAGRNYQILSATNVTAGFILRAGVTPTNSVGLWSEPDNSAPQRFYRVKSP